MRQISIPDQTDALCLLGLEGLNDFKPLEWLSRDRDLYLVDHSDRSIPSKIANHPRVRLFLIETPLQHESMAKNVAWHAVMQRLHVHCQPGWEEFRLRLEECHRAAHILLSDTADFGQQALSNARCNWQNNGPFRHWAGLKNRFSNVPAIVCGAGPSLTEAAEHLYGLSSRALLLSAGTAGSILDQWGIRPHLSFFLDKETPPDHSCLEVPACLQSRLNPACVHWMQGEKILAPESGPLPWEKWWMEADCCPSFGWTAGNFATQMAVWMGCAPIIWVGMDLCYRDGQKYAGRTDASQVPLIEWCGKMTQRDWLLAASWNEELSRDHPEIRFVNTAMQGLPMHSPIIQMELAAIDRELTQEFDLLGRVHQTVQNLNELTWKSQRKEADWLASWERCAFICNQLDQDGELEQEAVYEYYLEPLWRIWRPLLNREAKGQNLDLHRYLFFQQVLQNGRI